MTFLITLFAFILTGYITLRMKPKNPVTAVVTLIGYSITFIILLTLLKSVLPRYFVSALPGFQANWQPVWAEAAGAGNGAVQRVNGWLDLDVPQITVEELPQELPVGNEGVVTPTAVPFTAETQAEAEAAATPQAIAAQSPTANPQPTPTITETRKLPLYEALHSAQGSNDRYATAAALRELLALDPYDPIAAQVRLQVQAAEERLTAYRMLSGIPLQLTKNPERQQQVNNALRGGQYVVSDNGAAFTNFACQEVATLIDETPGYTYGTAVTLPRCYLEPYKATKTGARFSVP
jgi:hypothetical protein